MSGPRVSLLLILFWCTCGLKENLDHDDKKVVFWSTKHLQSFFKGLSFLSSLTSEQGGRSTMCILSQKFHVFWASRYMTWVGINRTKLLFFLLPFIGLTGFLFFWPIIFSGHLLCRGDDKSAWTPHIFMLRGNFQKNPNYKMR